LKFLFDHNLSPAWPRALRALSDTLKHVDEVVALRDRFEASSSDAIWLKALAEEGDWAIVSADGFRKSDAEKQLIHKAGLAVFVLAPTWNHFAHWERTVQIIRWWPKMVEQAQLARVAVRVPWKTSSRFDSLRY
jgi:hypothetical protein